MRHNVLALFRWIHSRKEIFVLHFVLFLIQFTNALHIVCMRYATVYIHPFAYAMLRIMMAVPILFAFSYRPGQPKIMPKGRTWLWIIALSMFGVVFNQVLVVSAMRFSTATTAVILLPTIPTVTLTVGLIFRQESFAWTKVLAIVLSFIGVIALSGFDRLAQFSDSRVLIGSTLLVLNFASFAIYLVLQKLALQRFPNGLVLTSWTMLTGGIVILVAGTTSILTGLVELRWDVPPLGWICVTFSGVAGTGLIYMGTTYALKRTSVSMTSGYSSVQAIVGTMLAWSILGERIEWMQAIGAPFILGGLILSVREQYLKEKMGDTTQYKSLKGDHTETTNGNVIEESVEMVRIENEEVR
ncbi:permease, DMT superfamily [Planoprotostelium fungivorum]|uniref:Permease, DMT superfamily n=1 Tax=Planoprotostelium fungivorum TaxID=1890364 RepID=A0A2P6NFQ2_9EUKA|nr:permease, DMT superfamily [Planoprotostelium fungivorum]